MADRSSLSGARRARGREPGARPVEVDPAQRPWSLVWILAAAQLVAWGTLYYAFAALVGPIERELGWSKATLNGALALGLATWGLAAPAVGAFIDRRGARLVMTAGSLGGATLLFMAASVESAWALYAIWAALGACMAAVLYEPAFAVVFSAFRSDHRRAIMALTLVGGFASTVFIPLTQTVVEAWGFRDALRALAGLTFFFCALPHALVLKGDDGRVSTRALRGPAPSSASTARARGPVLLGLGVWFAAHSAIFAGVTFHLIPWMTAHGVDSKTRIAVVAVIGPMQVAGRLVLWAMGPRSSVRAAGAVAAALVTLAVAILSSAPGASPALFAFATLYGLANGITTLVRGMAVPEYLGDARYATTNGVLALPANVARALSPLALAWAWAAGGPGAMTAALLALCLVALGAYGLATWHRGSGDLAPRLENPDPRGPRYEKRPRRT